MFKQAVQEVWTEDDEKFHIIPANAPVPNTVNDIKIGDYPKFSLQGFKYADKAWRSAIISEAIDPEAILPKTVIYRAFLRHGNESYYTWNRVLKMTHGDKELAIELLKAVRFEHLETILEMWLSYDPKPQNVYKALMIIKAGIPSFSDLTS